MDAHHSTLDGATLNEPPSPSTLTRAVGFWGLAAAIVNITIGGSIFALPGTLYLALGPAAPLAYILGAALFAPIVLCFAAAGSRLTTTGGPYRYVEAAFGSFAGVLVAAVFWVSSVTGSAGMAAILASQAAHILPILQQPVYRALVSGRGLRGFSTPSTPAASGWEPAPSSDSRLRR